MRRIGSDECPAERHRRPRAERIPGNRGRIVSLGGHDGYLHEVNEAFATLLGRRTDEVNGRSLLEFVHPDDLVTIVAGIAALERGEREVMMENRFLQSKGGAVHLQWVARPVPGTDTWWAAGRNTTEFHLLLAQRLDLRASLDLALGQRIAALWDLDVKTGVFTWEPQAAELLGVAADELPVTAHGLAGTVHPEDSAGLLEALQGLTARRRAEAGLGPVGPRLRKQRRDACAPSRAGDDHGPSDEYSFSAGGGIDVLR